MSLLQCEKHGHSHYAVACPQCVREQNPDSVDVLRARAAAAESRASAAEVALRELVRLKDGPRDDAYRIAKAPAWAAARLALSGLPPLASETAEAALRVARKEEGYAVGVVGGAVKEPRPALEAIAANLREKAAQEEARCAAQPTPAALVPKEEA